jgi:hypothetical protein
MRDKGEPRFRYSVRQSSQRFFNCLLDVSTAIDGERNLSDIIKDQPWFRLTWMHDPTIAGALAMINAIANAFKSEDGGELYRKLTSSEDSPITMDVLDLGSLGQSEEIYIKMNARGKELTGFEKFKAWLIDAHRELQWPEGAGIRDKWQTLLDGRWLDLFWHFHHQEKSPADPASKAFFRTVVALAINFHASSPDGKFKPEWLDEDKTDDPAIWEDLFTKACVKSVFENLDNLSQKNAAQELSIVALRDRLPNSSAALFDRKLQLQSFLIDLAERLTLKSRLWLHATCSAIEARWQAGSQEETHWFRVVRNLLQQSSFDSKNYANAVEALDILSESVRRTGSILKSLIGAELEVKGINSDQLQEERKKARLILAENGGNQWEVAIAEIECHSVFEGQIDLLIPADEKLDTFQNRCAIAKMLWDKDGNGSLVGATEYLVARAILAKCEPFRPDYQERINLSDGAANWCKQFDRSEGWKEFREAVPVVLDSLRGIEFNNIDSALRVSLQTYIPKRNWIDGIINWGDILLKGSQGNIQNYKGHGVFVFWKDYSNENDILIDPLASLRNQLICRLVRHLDWTLSSETTEEREVKIDDDIVYYRGHRVPIQKKRQESQTVSCTVGYGSLTFRVIQQPELAPVEVRYPNELSFGYLKQELMTKLGETKSNVLQEALKEVAQVCDMLPEQNLVQNESMESQSLITQ